MSPPRAPGVPDFSVRPMVPGDMESVHMLSAQLGYSPMLDQLAERFAFLAEQGLGAFYVAEVRDAAGVIGWLHVYGVHTLVSTPYAEIASIVVDEASRLTGVGRTLMHEAERWALDHHYNEVRLRSGHHRSDAHRFYRQIGYEIARPSHTFRRYLRAIG